METEKKKHTYRNITVTADQLGVDQFTPEQIVFIEKIIDSPIPIDVANEKRGTLGLNSGRVRTFAVQVTRNRLSHV